ncbi:GNAT family N-acetyltransferase [Pseudooceanicola aestuarii]|uniref:GNAT family N-acetyltransferase n=1 Tax=Pseudooceanicola aestuarii TaxID=2697319 RepID=UPI0013D7A207|nr:GNAT family N-acetyltransferase [Pseudooceanicola aestuarii]
MTAPITFRAAQTGDVPALLAIWNPVIRDTLVTFASVERDAPGLTALIAARRAAGRAFVIVQRGDAVLGFASYDQFRGGDGYRHCMEHTVILGPEARGQGLGRALMARVEDHARDAGHRVMVGGISAANPAAIDFHLALGYAEVGRMPGVGTKFNERQTLVLVQKHLC